MSTQDENNGLVHAETRRWSGEWMVLCIRQSIIGPRKKHLTLRIEASTRWHIYAILRRLSREDLTYSVLQTCRVVVVGSSTSSTSVVFSTTPFILVL